MLSCIMIRFHHVRGQSKNTINTNTTILKKKNRQTHKN